MTSEVNKQYTAEEVAQTNVAKGFEAFVYVSDLMKRYKFDLRVTRGGRIFQDPTTEMKLRRKEVKGDKDQNEIFEAYKTQDGNNVVKSTLTFDDNAFTPAMAIAATAAHMAKDSDTTATRISLLLLQAASAIMAEQDKEDKLIATKLNPEQDPTKAEFYKNLTDLSSRAYTLTALSDVLQYTVGDNANLYDLSDTLAYASAVTDEVHGEGARAEFTANKNVLFGAIATLALSQVSKDMRVMADEIIANIGEAATVELSGTEQVVS